MTIQIFTIGGYEEVGKNMTAIKVDDEIVICDMGINLENFINYTEDKIHSKLTKKELLHVNAIPNDTEFMKYKHMVKAIVPSHAHLDHVGAIPYMAKNYDAPVIGTPYTIAVLDILYRENEIPQKNKLIQVKPNGKFRVTKRLSIELINVTHSTPQSALIAIHTQYGTILYANDFKLDNSPVLGLKTNTKRLQELDVHTLIMESTYSKEKDKMRSESIARELLKDVMLNTDFTGKNVAVTTFSSHLARIKSIIEFGKKMDRKVVLLGRSLSKYIDAGIATKVFQLPEDVEVVRFSKKIRRFFTSIRNTEKYLFVVTGHQGETKAVLSKMSKGSVGFRFKPEDAVLFSCTVIPTETNIKNREDLEDELEKQKIRIYRNLHVSGHGAKEDLRDMILMTRPRHIIPAHGFTEMKKGVRALALEMRYDDNSIHVLKNEENIILD